MRIACLGTQTTSSRIEWMLIISATLCMVSYLSHYVFERRLYHNTGLNLPRRHDKVSSFVLGATGMTDSTSVDSLIASVWLTRAETKPPFRGMLQYPSYFWRLGVSQIVYKHHHHVKLYAAQNSFSAYWIAVVVEGCRWGGTWRTRNCLAVPTRDEY